MCECKYEVKCRVNTNLHVWNYRYGKKNWWNIPYLGNMEYFENFDELFVIDIIRDLWLKLAYF